MVSEVSTDQTAFMFFWGGVFEQGCNPETHSRTGALASSVKAWPLLFFWDRTCDLLVTGTVCCRTTFPPCLFTTDLPQHKLWLSLDISVLHKGLTRSSTAAPGSSSTKVNFQAWTWISLQHLLVLETKLPFLCLLLFASLSRSVPALSRPQTLTTWPLERKGSN